MVTTCSKHGALRQETRHHFRRRIRNASRINLGEHGNTCMLCFCDWWHLHAWLPQESMVVLPCRHNSQDSNSRLSLSNVACTKASRNQTADRCHRASRQTQQHLRTRLNAAGGCHAHNGAELDMQASVLRWHPQGLHQEPCACFCFKYLK